MFNITTKLEVNVFKNKDSANDFYNLPAFLIKNRIPVLVTDPEFIDPALIGRNAIKGGYKIISLVNFDRQGRDYALAKIRDLPANVFDADGLEIMLTPNRNDKECLNELKVLIDFIKQRNPLMEIRWAFDFYSKKPLDYSNFFQYLKQCPATAIRLQPNIITPKPINHAENIQVIKDFCGNQIKLSGNIGLKTIKEYPTMKFDVSVSQAKAIIKELENELAQPQTTIKGTQEEVEVVEK